MLLFWKEELFSSHVYRDLQDPISTPTPHPPPPMKLCVVLGVRNGSIQSLHAVLVSDGDRARVSFTCLKDNLKRPNSSHSYQHIGTLISYQHTTKCCNSPYTLHFQTYLLRYITMLHWYPPKPIRTASDYLLLKNCVEKIEFL